MICSIRWTCAPLFTIALAAVPAFAAAQTQPDRPESSVQDHRHDMQSMPGMSMPGDETSNREASGTSWQPDDTPMYALHAQTGDWTLMAHGSAFLQYFADSGPRGSDQFGSINWVMGMADRSLGAGHFGIRAMVSGEPWTTRDCGYPDLLASGELCDGAPIHDRQHPHDLFMEVAATYDRPLTGNLRLQLYGGPAGEPALGPTAFPHRLSAMPNPLAPVTHHWFDATHITFGVATAGVYGKRWKAEASVFNGREPDENRANFDFAALDSVSARVWFVPTSQWALQVSAGHLKEAEAGHDGAPRIDVTRVTASASYHVITSDRVWASTFGWGRNQASGGDGTNALLAETNFTLNDRDSWFGRFELSEKSSHDLAVEGGEVFTIAKLQGGYVRSFADWKGLRPGIGGTLSAGVVPDSLATVYGRRLNPGAGVFLTVRPGRPGM